MWRDFKTFAKLTTTGSLTFIMVTQTSEVEAELAPLHTGCLNLINIPYSIL